MDMPTRPPGRDLICVVRHWMAEAVAAFAAEADYGSVTKMMCVMKALDHEFPIEGEKNPLNLTQDEMNWLLNGQIILGIKEIRARTGLGLKDAKDLAEAYLGKMGHVKYAGQGGEFAGKVNEKGEVKLGFNPPLYAKGGLT